MTKLREDYFLGLGLELVVGDKTSILGGGTWKLNEHDFPEINTITSKSRTHKIESFAWRDSDLPYYNQMPIQVLFNNGMVCDAVVFSIDKGRCISRDDSDDGWDVKSWRYDINKLIEMQIDHDAGFKVEPEKETCKRYCGVLHNNKPHTPQCRSYLGSIKYDSNDIKKAFKAVADKAYKDSIKKESVAISDLYKLRSFDVKNAFQEIADKGIERINNIKKTSHLEKDVAMILLDYKENDLGTLSTAKRITALINK